MARRTEIFSPENIAALLPNNRFLIIFTKDTWPEYLELIAQIYELLEDRGARVEHAEVSLLVDRYYLRRKLASIDQKNVAVLSMFISELGILRDSHDSVGIRYIEPTRDGKQFLRICERLIQNRTSYTGAGADALLSSMNLLLAKTREITVPEAIDSHREVIKRYREDIARIEEKGVAASELLNPGFSQEELFQQADEEASKILAAGEDVKLAVENARKELIKSYHDRAFTAGRAIEFIADFHDALRSRPEYQSFVRAKDLFSHLEGLSSAHRSRDVEEMFHELLKLNLFPSHLLNRSSIHAFSRQFQSIVRGIEEKVREQIQLLRVQVHYVVTGDSRRTREDLTELQGALFNAGVSALRFLGEQRFRIPDGLELEIGSLVPHELELKEDLLIPAMERNLFGLGDESAIASFLKKADEATVEQVLKKLQAELDRHGSAQLSGYAITFGIIEYYVLALVSSFSQVIRSEAVGVTDVEWIGGDRCVRLRNVTDYRYSFSS